MPKIFEKDGYSFFFYSSEHRPIHVHVRRAGGEVMVELRESQGLKVAELTRAQELATEHQELIIRRWSEYFNR